MIWKISKQHEHKQKVFHTMKVNNEKAIEVKNELKINVDEQHVIKYLQWKNCLKKRIQKEHTDLW